MKKSRLKKMILGFSAVLVVVVVLLPSVSYAKKTLSDATPALKTVSGQSGVTDGDISSVMANVIKTGIAFSGILFFILMVYAGITWMTAQGKDEQVQKAQKTLIGAMIGIIVVIGSYAITNFVQTRIIEGQTGASVAPPDRVGDDSPMGCCYDWVASTQAGVAIGGIKVSKGIISENHCTEIGNNNPNEDDLINDKFEFNEGWSLLDCNEGL